jgi:hypothetical protein
LLEHGVFEAVLVEVPSGLYPCSLGYFLLARLALQEARGVRCEVNVAAKEDFIALGLRPLSQLIAY